MGRTRNLRSLGVAVAVVVSVTMALPPAPLFASYVLDFWTSGKQHYQWEASWCVAATAEQELNYINGTTNTTYADQQENYTTARGTRQSNTHMRLYYSAAGLDGRAWAWLLWRETPSGYSYNDYIYGSASSGDTRLMWSLRDTNKPAGVMVWNGHHAINALGFQATADPIQGGSLLGFYVWDPWYLRSGKAGGAWGYGIPGNTYETLAHFNSTDSAGRILFSQNYESETPGDWYWDHFWVLILRSSAAGTIPQDYPPAPWGTHGTSAATFAPDSPSDSTISAALDQGLSSQGLIENNQLDLRLRSASVGRTISVTSVTEGIPSYVLAEVVVEGSVVALAQLNVGSDGYRFAALAPVTPGSRLPTITSARDVIGGSALSPAAKVDAVWAPSDLSESPFFPIWRVLDGPATTYVYPDLSARSTLSSYNP